MKQKMQKLIKSMLEIFMQQSGSLDGLFDPSQMSRPENMFTMAGLGEMFPMSGFDDINLEKIFKFIMDFMKNQPQGSLDGMFNPSQLEGIKDMIPMTDILQMLGIEDLFNMSDIKDVFKMAGLEDFDMEMLDKLLESILDIFMSGSLDALFDPAQMGFRDTLSMEGLGELFPMGGMRDMNMSMEGMMNMMMNHMMNSSMLMPMMNGTDMSLEDLLQMFGVEDMIGKEELKEVEALLKEVAEVMMGPPETWLEELFKPENIAEIGKLLSIDPSQMGEIANIVKMIDFENPDPSMLEKLFKFAMDFIMKQAGGSFGGDWMSMLNSSRPMNM